MSGSVAITITHSDKLVEYDLLEPDDNRIAKGKSRGITDDAELHYEGTLIRKGLDAPNVAEFILQFGSSVTSGVVASWLYNKLQGKDISSFQIGGEEVDIDEDSIQTKLDRYLK
ncbi:hypothetical protein [Halomontanus rarus]|uniref:hypothetical protein n=1 Tax=Halomontanus rarus TaxID=3034020 RepID=UPI001A998D48